MILSALVIVTFGCSEHRVSEFSPKLSEPSMKSSFTDEGQLKKSNSRNFYGDFDSASGTLAVIHDTKEFSVFRFPRKDKLPTNQDDVATKSLVREVTLIPKTDWVLCNDGFNLSLWDTKSHREVWSKKMSNLIGSYSKVGDDECNFVKSVDSQHVLLSGLLSGLFYANINAKGISIVKQVSPPPKDPSAIRLIFDAQSQAYLLFSGRDHSRVSCYSNGFGKHLGSIDIDRNVIAIGHGEGICYGLTDLGEQFEINFQKQAATKIRDSKTQNNFENGIYLGKLGWMAISNNVLCSIGTDATIPSKIATESILTIGRGPDEKCIIVAGSGRITTAKLL